MVTRFRNRLLATSLALAAAGLLACIAAVLNAFFPRGSLPAFIGWMFTAGLATAAVMVGFAWICEIVDERSRVRQRKPDERPGEWAVTSARVGRPAVQLDRAARSVNLLVSPPLHYYPLHYPLTPCGATPTGRRNSRAGHAR